MNRAIPSRQVPTDAGRRCRPSALALLCGALVFCPVLTAVAADGEGVSPVLWGGIAGGIALALLTGAAILVNMRLRARRERDLFASSLDTLPVARQIVAPDGSVMFASTVYRRMFPDAERPMKAVLEGQLAGEPAEADRLGQLEAQAAAGIAGHTEITIRTSSGNIEWREVKSLLDAAGATTEEHNGKLKVTLGGETEVLEPPRGKDVDAQMIVDLRRMFTRAGATTGDGRS